MRNRSLYLLKGSLLVFDLFILNGCYWFTFGLLSTYKANFFTEGGYRHYWAVYNIIWLLCSVYFNLYRSNTNISIEKNYSATAKSLVAHALLLVAYFAFRRNTIFSREFVICLYIVLAIVFTFSRFVMTIIDNLYRRSWKNKPAVAVLGDNATGNMLAEYFKSQSFDYRFSGILDQGQLIIGYNEIEGLQEHIRRGIKQAELLNIQELYAAIPPERMHQVRGMMEEAENSFIRLKLVPNMTTTAATRFHTNFMDKFTVVTLRPEPLDDMGNRLIKRLFDLSFSTFVILFVLSWLYPILAIFIKLQSSGPVLFKQERSGRNNKPFWCYKFRSMKVNDESNTRQASKNDNRITKIGAFLRKTSLDELPQFFNVWKGEMSVVGPRPHMLSHTEQYKAIVDSFMVRHFLKPGITGWAQVTGFRGETKDPALMVKRVEKDIWYLENWSIMLDIRIIFLTIFNALKGEENAF